MENNNLEQKMTDKNTDSTIETGFVKDCIFCKIVKKEIPAKIVAENSKAIAFLDIDPISDAHLLVIPKRHYENLMCTDDEYLNSVMKLAKFIANTIAKTKELDAWGFNYLSNQGSVAGQVVNHFHLHIIPKYAKEEGFKFSVENKFLSKTTDQVYDILVKQAKKQLEKKKSLFEKMFDKKINKNNEKTKE